MNALKRWTPLAAAFGTAAVLILRAFGLNELAALVDQSGGDVVAALVLLAGFVLKMVSLYQERQWRKETGVR